LILNLSVTNNFLASDATARLFYSLSSNQNERNVVFPNLVLQYSSHSSRIS
jgi:hypothetical protein